MANVGLGKLTPELQKYLASNLQRLTGGNLERPIIVFCLADCWMSWNAVQRTAALGYKRIFWYSDGTDGWRDWDRPLEVKLPEPLQTSQVAAKAGETVEDTAASTPLPEGEKTVTLITAGGERLDIATASFSKGSDPNTRTFTVKLKEDQFREEFLSMRPFLCLPDSKEMWCHLAYPYETKRQISAADLHDLEYALLFLFKPPQGYGIDAWNGLYFKLQLNADGTIDGPVHETDMNVLAVPPEKGELRPISHGALMEVDAKTHRFARVEIK